MTFSSYIKTFAVSSLFLLIGCKSSDVVTSDASKQPKPTWVQMKPANPFYYIGIGVAPIMSDGSHFQKAKSNALSDLSSEISVEVNATSMLYQLEHDQKFREEFKAQTQLNSLEAIEGFELVGTYEDQYYYYIQYRLEKSTYAERRAARKSNAVRQAMEYYNLALQSYKNLDIILSLTQSLKALEEVKVYLNEPIQAEGVQGDFGIALNTFVDQLVDEIHINPSVERFTKLRYMNDTGLTQFFVTTTSQGKQLSNIPVYLYYTGGFLRENAVKSDARGAINIQLPKAEGAGEHERLEADINLVAISEMVTKDPLLRILLTRRMGNHAEVKVDIRAPYVYIESKELLEGESMENTPIAQAMKSFLLENHFAIASSKDYCSMRVQIQAFSNASLSNDGMYTSQLSGEILISNAQGQQLRSFPLTDFRGVQLSKQAAGRAAFSNAITELKDHQFRKLFTE